jgi:hypothetical protein
MELTCDQCDAKSAERRAPCEQQLNRISASLCFLDKNISHPPKKRAAAARDSTVQEAAGAGGAAAAAAAAAATAHPAAAALVQQQRLAMKDRMRRCIAYAG